jgi:hypothetical protein
LDLTDPFISRCRHWLACYAVLSYLIFRFFWTRLVLMCAAIFLRLVLSWNLVTKHKLFKLFLLSVLCYTMPHHYTCEGQGHAQSEWKVVPLHIVLCSNWVWNYAIHTCRSLEHWSHLVPVLFHHRWLFIAEVFRML